MATALPRSAAIPTMGNRKSHMSWVTMVAAGQALPRIRRPSSSPSEQANRFISLEELAAHTRMDDLWMALGGIVYDVTPYLDYHPGGRAQLLRGAGIDATALFASTHPWVNLSAILSPCVVGRLEARRAHTLPLSSPQVAAAVAAVVAPGFLVAAAVGWQHAMLLWKRPIATRGGAVRCIHLRFELPTGHSLFQLPQTSVGAALQLAHAEKATTGASEGVGYIAAVLGDGAPSPLDRSRGDLLSVFCWSSPRAQGYFDVVLEQKCEVLLEQECGVSDEAEQRLGTIISLSGGTGGAPAAATVLSSIVAPAASAAASAPSAGASSVLPARPGKTSVFDEVWALLPGDFALIRGPLFALREGSGTSDEPSSSGGEGGHLAYKAGPESTPSAAAAAARGLLVVEDAAAVWRRASPQGSSSGGAQVSRLAPVGCVGVVAQGMRGLGAALPLLWNRNVGARDSTTRVRLLWFPEPGSAAEDDVWGELLSRRPSCAAESRIAVFDATATTLLEADTGTGSGDTRTTEDSGRPSGASPQPLRATSSLLLQLIVDAAASSDAATVVIVCPPLGGEGGTGSRAAGDWTSAPQLLHLSPNVVIAVPTDCTNTAAERGGSGGAAALAAAPVGPTTAGSSRAAQPHAASAQTLGALMARLCALWPPSSAQPHASGPAPSDAPHPARISISGGKGAGASAVHVPWWPKPASDTLLLLAGASAFRRECDAAARELYYLATAIVELPT